jgi:tetratricopeptide (TPR) repeat protein
VEAGPPSAAYRFRKFARRNKGPLMTATLLAGALLMGSVISTWQAVRATRALEAESVARREAVDARNQELQARQQAENDRARAQANLGKAREAVQQITQIADEKLSNVPHMEGVRRELLESALQFYLDFLRQESNDRNIRRETAIAYGRAAEIHRYMGNKSKAEELMRESIVRLEKLAAEPEGTPADRAALVNYYNALPFYAIAPRDEMVAKQRRAIELAEQLVKEFTDDLSYKRGLTRSYGILGRSLVPAQLEEAERCMRHSLLLAEEMGDQVAIAAACGDLGYLMMNKSNPEAEQWFRRAIAIWEKQGTQSSWHRFHREMLARYLSELGNSLVSAGKPKEAAEAFRRSVDIWLALMKDYPSVPESRAQCAYNYLQLGKSLSAAGQDTQADVAFQKALERAPQDASLHNNLAWRLVTSADAKLRDPDGVVKMAKRAVELAPNEGYYWNTLGVAQYRAGKWQAAIDALGKSMELRAGGDAADWFFLAMAHWQLGHQDDARRWYGQAVEWMEKNKERLDTKQPMNRELRRFRTEADKLLKTTDEKPTTKPPVEVK